MTSHGAAANCEGNPLRRPDTTAWPESDGRPAGSLRVGVWHNTWVPQTSKGMLVNWLCAVSVVLLGTVNLWKVASIREFFPVDLTAASAALAGAVALGVWAASRWRLERAWLPLAIGFASFAPAMAVTSLNHPYSVEKARYLFTLSLLCAAAPMVVLTNEYRRRAFLVLLVGLGSIVSVWLLVAGAKSPLSGRVGIEDGSPIGLSRVACLVVAILGIAVFHWEGRRRLYALATIVVAAGAAAITGSRGPLASAILGTLLVVALTDRGALHLHAMRRGAHDPKIRTRILAIGGVVVVSAGAALLWITPARALARLFALGGPSDVMRIQFLKESSLVALQHPFGVGWGDLAAYLSAAARKYSVGDHVYPHNVFVEVAAEGGVIALAGMVYLLVVSWRRLYAAASAPAARALLAVWVLAVGSAMTSSDVIGNRLMWMMIGVGLAYPQLDRRLRRERHLRRSKPDPLRQTKATFGAGQEPTESQVSL